MHTTRRYIRSLTSLAMLCALALLAVSCAWVVDPSESPTYTPDSANDKNTFQIHFHICTFADGKSRAESIEEEGSGAENFLDIYDIQYFIFDKERKFLLDLTTTVQKTTLISPDYALYDVVAKIDETKCDYFKINKSGLVDFYIMALANYSGYGISHPTLAKGDDISTLFSSNALTMNRPPNTAQLMKANDKSAKDDDRNYFPMAGLQHFSLSGTWFETQAGEVPIDLTYITGRSLNMLRALAKIEVIDRINMPPNAIYDEAIHGTRRRISSIQINGVMKTGRLLPTKDQWDINNIIETRQVTAPSTTGAGYYLIPPILSDGKLTTTPNISNGYSLDFVRDFLASERLPDKCPVYSCYVWEYSQAELPTTIDMTQSPFLTINTTEHLKPDGILESTYFHRLSIDTTTTDDTETKTEPVKALLRNHIYRYEVTGAGAHINIDWTICPMDKATADIEFH